MKQVIVETKKEKTEAVDDLGITQKELSQAGKFIPQVFQKRYQRNNKRGGLKNLRCFPQCSNQHKERGFCGRPVVVQVLPSENIPTTDNLICWAQFVPVEEKFQFGVGTVLPLTKLLSIEKTKSAQLRPWMRGRVVSKELIDSFPALQTGKRTKLSNTLGKEGRIFAFNMEMKGWHYGWASNKHSCNALHCFQVNVFTAAAQGTRTDPATVNAITSELVNINCPLVHHSSSEFADSTEGTPNGDKSEATEELVIEFEQNPKHALDEKEKDEDGDGKDSATTAREQYIQDTLKEIDCEGQLPEQVSLRCVATIQSSNFQLFCRRRRRFIIEPTAPAAIKKECTGKKGGQSKGNGSKKRKKKKQDKNSQPKPANKGSEAKTGLMPKNRERSRSTNDLDTLGKESLVASEGLMQLVQAATTETKGEQTISAQHDGSSSGHSTPNSPRLNKRHRSQSHSIPVSTANDDAIVLLLGFSGKS
eukprot:CAMPEP_0203761146 /NCGR_PEP_ID=MMETSP0098-20131031/14299_1 /ASSEMBLY_ACC=CAM_ASM_000208 /TAXON_ID=96639 /ORGANISM=" , Strain NY0313808BC1" /LENGTH=475 /DNA_ID=CAMNT_0050655019 /DNA_START=261 /DNA_END=1688 /DNA_ORIENTATION=+